MRRPIALCTLIALLGATSVAYARIYKWTDRAGVFHATDDRDQVPADVLAKADAEDAAHAPKRDAGRKAKKPHAKRRKKHRKKRRTSKRRASKRASEHSRQREPAARPAPKQPTDEERDAALENEFRAKMKAARARVAAAKADLAAAEHEARIANNGIADPGYAQRREDAMKRLEAAKKSLAAARNYRDAELWEEARRAGVAPGVLRE